MCLYWSPGQRDVFFYPLTFRFIVLFDVFCRVLVDPETGWDGVRTSFPVFGARKLQTRQKPQSAPTSNDRVE